MAKTPKSTDEVDAVTEAVVTIKSKSFIMLIEATYHDAFGSRSEVFRFDNADPGMTDEAIGEAIKARFA